MLENRSNNAFLNIIFLPLHLKKAKKCLIVLYEAIETDIIHTRWTNISNKHVYFQSLSFNIEISEVFHALET